MSTINQQPLADPLSLSDLIAIWSSGNSDTRRASLTALLALIQDNITFPSSSAVGQVVFLPFVGGTNNIIAQPAADVALPAAPAFGQTVEWIGTGTNTGAVTIAVTSSGGAQPVKAVQYKGAALIGGEIVAGGSALAVYDGAAYQLVASSAPAPTVPVVGNSALVNGYLEWTVAANALTLAVKTLAGNDPTPAVPVYYQVRDVTAGVASMSLRSITAALSLVVPNGALLGTVSAIPFRLWATIFNDGGVDRLGVINCLSTSAAPSASGRVVTAIYPLDGFNIGTSIAVSAAANLAQTFYTNNGVASKAYATIGYATWEAGLVTAGQWSANPTQKQLFGNGVLLPGQEIQCQRFPTGVMATGVTQLPLDDTIPQITEGTQFMTQTATAASAANVFGVRSRICGSAAAGGAGYESVALFKDAVANALTAVTTFRGAAEDGGQVPQYVEYKEMTGTTALVTYRLRAGFNGAATYTFNGQTAARLFGGVLNSFLEVTEIMA